MNYLKLFVKRMGDSPQITIYDGNGIELPAIQSISIDYFAGEIPKMTVVFVLGNDYITIDSKIEQNK